jgi:hypothetical protein
MTDMARTTFPDKQAAGVTMYRIQGTEFFQCDRCSIECRIDSVELGPAVAQLIIHHCQESRGIPIRGRVTRFQERRGGVWVDVQRWIDAA